MNRKFLESLNIDKDTIDEIMKEYGKAITKQIQTAKEGEELERQFVELTKQKEELEAELARVSTDDRATLLAEKEERLNSLMADDMRARVAIQSGLPYELHSRLQGENEQELAKDAERLHSLLNVKTVLPLAQPSNDKVDGYTSMIRNLTD